MNEKQFSDRIGNVNDKLIRQAEQIPNYRRTPEKKYPAACNDCCRYRPNGLQL